MTEQTPASAVGAPGAGAGIPRTPGAMLRSAREAAGLSLDAVAQQLKLAPRQVTALEADDYARLPGRTFVRGFLRNYARLVRVDPDKVLSALSGGDASTLDSPTLQPTAPTIGELPTTDHAKPGLARWAIPLTLVAVIAAAAIYEFTRGRNAQRAAEAPATASEPEAVSAPNLTPKPATEVAGTPLPNPIASQAAQGETAAKEPAGTVVGAAPASTPPSAAAPAPEVTLVLTYRDSAWTEVKDGRGQLLVAQTIASGQTRSIAGIPPLLVTIGNANKVSATVGGQPLDLAPFVEKNVARFVLK